MNVFELSDPLEGKECLVQLKNYEHLKVVSVPWGLLRKHSGE